LSPGQSCNVPLRPQIVAPERANLARAAASKRRADGLGGLALAAADHVDESRARDDARRPAAGLQSRHEQHAACAAFVGQGKQQASAGGERVEPNIERRCRARVGVDRVGRRQRAGGARTLLQRDVGAVREIFARPRRERRVDLEGFDMSARAHELGEDRGVIARSRADMQNALAGLQAERRDPGGMRARLAVVDAVHRVERDQSVDIDEAGIVGLRHHIAAAPGTRDAPRSGSEEFLARHGGESGAKPRLVDAGMRRHITRVPFAHVGYQRVRHQPSAFLASRRLGGYMCWGSAATAREQL